MPVLTYGLEIIQPSRTEIQELETFQYTKLKQILSLPNNTPGEACSILLGIPLVEYTCHRKALCLYGNICNHVNSIEWQVIERQLAMKQIDSRSWVSMSRKLLAIYSLPSAYDIFENPPTKGFWRKTVSFALNRHWEEAIESRTSCYSSLRFLCTSRFRIGELHVAADSVGTSITDVRRAHIKYKLLTGIYPCRLFRPPLIKMTALFVCYVV